MWDERKMLLLAAIIVLTLTGTVEGATALDLTEDAVGPPSDECREKVLNSGVLKEELRRSEEFQRAWSANTSCQHVIPGRRPEHTTALSVYANGDKTFIKTFNDAVQTQGTDLETYAKSFQFKSLHYLLTDSMTDGECKTVYYLTEDYTATKDSHGQFGRFITAYSNYSELRESEDWDGKFFFNITTCFFVDLGQNICSEDNLVLLSPTEGFRVRDVNNKTDENGAEYTEIVLEPFLLEMLNICNLFSRSPANVSTQWLVLLPVALSLSSLSLFN